YTDLYQLTMAQGYFETKPDGRAVFDYYFRNNPFNGGFSIFAGLEDVVYIFVMLIFSAFYFVFFEYIGFSKDFIDYLKDFRFRLLMWLIWSNTDFQKIFWII